MSLTDSRGFDLDVKREETHVFIQWKGTDACFDFHCDCGAHMHIDAEFAYAVKCSACERVWQMPSILFPRLLPAGTKTNFVTAPSEDDDDD